jgi:transketolase
MTLVEPSCEAEVDQLLNWCIHDAPGSCYLRLVSLPWDIPYQLPFGYKPKFGQGVSLNSGGEVTIIAYGPVLLTAAFNASQIILRDKKIDVKVINIPWLNYIDPAWLKNELGACRLLLSLDNHFIIGGQADAIMRALYKPGKNNINFISHGIDGEIPPSGTNAEVLNKLNFDVDAIVEIIRKNI